MTMLLSLLRCRRLVESSAPPGARVAALCWRGSRGPVRICCAAFTSPGLVDYSAIPRDGKAAFKARAPFRVEIHDDTVQAGALVLCQQSEAMVHSLVDVLSTRVCNHGR